MNATSAAAPGGLRTGLRKECLGFAEVVAQSVANIAPTATPTLLIPLVFASAGNGTWLVYVIATMGLLLVSANINGFARRSASAGSLYSYVHDSTHPKLGALTGWALFRAYLFTAAAVPLAFASYASLLLGASSLAAQMALVCAVTLLSFAMAYKDVRLSTKSLLALESVSVTLIVLLATVVVARHGWNLRGPQFSLDGVTGEGVRLGLVLAVFSYVGFESATALGGEARDPLITIPRSVTASVAAAGIFFVLMSWIEVEGFRASGLALDKTSAPLVSLAETTHAPFFAAPISVGACFAFFACCLASINAGARVLYAMARGGQIHPGLGGAHARNATPHVAVAVTSALALLLPSGLLLAGAAILDAYAYLGTIATFGFLAVYIVVSLAAPFHLKRAGELKGRDVAVAIGSALFMVVPLVGSVYPVPAAPYDRLPYVFAALMAAGGVFLLR